MAWKWDELTARDFPKAVEQVGGVCVVPIGCLEKHGDHLPLGSDVVIADALTKRAAEKESALLFPALHSGQIHEAKHHPGAVALTAETLIRMLDETVGEIARNGLTKIILYCGHGGNDDILAHYCRTMLERPREFVLYLIRLEDYWSPVTNSDEWRRKMQSEFDLHGGEVETSLMLALRPDLVKMQNLSEPGRPMGRQAHLGGVRTAVRWYANFPGHYAGDAAGATAEKGRFLIERMTDRIAAMIKAVKEDQVTGQLQKEFFSRLQHG